MSLETLLHTLDKPHAADLVELTNMGVCLTVGL